MNRKITAAVAAWTIASSGLLMGDTITPVEDVMTSGFFTGANLVRGYDADDRNVHRVSTPGAFGVAGAETIYVSFDAADFAGFTAPVASAGLTVQSVSGGFGADADAANPFTVSAHGVTADPLTTITDDDAPSGPVSWVDFYNDNILAAAPGAATVVDSFGAVTFDVTSLVNDWLTGANSVFAVALTGDNHTAGGDYLHGFLNNSENPGSTFLTVNQADPVPEPGAWLIVLASCFTLAAWITRPLRPTHHHNFL